MPEDTQKSPTRTLTAGEQRGRPHRFLCLCFSAGSRVPPPCPPPPPPHAPAAARAAPAVPRGRRLDRSPPAPRRSARAAPSGATHPSLPPRPPRRPAGPKGRYFPSLLRAPIAPLSPQSLPPQSRPTLLPPHPPHCSGPGTALAPLGRGETRSSGEADASRFPPLPHRLLGVDVDAERLLLQRLQGDLHGGGGRPARSFPGSPGQDTARQEERRRNGGAQSPHGPRRARRLLGLSGRKAAGARSNGCGQGGGGAAAVGGAGGGMGRAECARAVCRGGRGVCP